MGEWVAGEVVEVGDYWGLADLNEDPFALVAGADFRRCKDARRNPITHCLKVIDDAVETEGQMASDVFKEDDLRFDFACDPSDVRPEVTGIVLARSEPGKCEGLTWITGREDMNAAAPRSSVEGFEIIPDRSCTQRLVDHPRHESGRGETVSLDITNSSISGFGDMNAEVEPSDA